MKRYLFWVFVGILWTAVGVGIYKSAHAADQAPQEHQAMLQLTNGRTHISLLAGQFECQGTDKRAVLVNAAGASWNGCWHVDEDKQTIEIAWEDGDHLSVPLKSIKGLPHEDAEQPLPGGAVPHGPQVES